MLRSDVEKLTGLTRKAVEYYEKRGLIEPRKSVNGNRDYSEEDLAILKKISMFRKLGLGISEIEEILNSGVCRLATILRKKEYESDLANKKRILLNNLLDGVNQETILEELDIIEKEETIFDKLERAFPGYFGQLMFAAYKPFLSSPLNDKGVIAFREYLTYLDHLPPFDLTVQEQKYIEESSSSIDLHTLEKINETKIQAISNSEEWLNEHKEMIAEYLEFKKSSDYINSPMKKIYDKLQAYMLENRYYEVAIPLIRQFSDSYDSYYQELEKANTVLVDQFQI